MDYILIISVVGGFLLVLVLMLWFTIYILFPVILGYGVPFVLTPENKIKKLLEKLNLTSGQKFLDIGCGDGKIVEAVKQKFPKAEAKGIENSFYPYFLAKKRQKLSDVSYKIERGNFFRKDISQYDVIYCFLLPLLMKRVWKKIETECKPGTLLYSSAFKIPNKSMKQVIKISKSKFIYVYEL